MRKEEAKPEPQTVPKKLSPFLLSHSQLSFVLLKRKEIKREEKVPLRTRPKKKGEKCPEFNRKKVNLMGNVINV